MLPNLFEIDNQNTTIYDGMHEYCTIEHVYEAHLRASLKRRIVLTKVLQGTLGIGGKGEGL